MYVECGSLLPLFADRACPVALLAPTKKLPTTGSYDERLLAVSLCSCSGGSLIFFEPAVEGQGFSPATQTGLPG